MAEMIRVNTRISKPINDYLDRRSEETGVPKSTLIYLALETWMNQQQAINVIPEMKKMLEQLERVNKGIELT